MKLTRESIDEHFMGGLFIVLSIFIVAAGYAFGWLWELIKVHQ